MSLSLNQSQSNGKSHSDAANIYSFLHTLDVYCAGYINDSAVFLHRVPSDFDKAFQRNEWKYGRLKSIERVRKAALSIPQD